MPRGRAPDVDAVDHAVTRGLQERCRRAGIPASRCYDLGLAVDQRFTDLPSDPAGIAALRRAGFAGQLRRSRLWRRRRIQRAPCAMHRRSPAPASISISWSSAVVTSVPIPRRRPALRTAAGREVRVLSYVTDMPQWMRAATSSCRKPGRARSPRRALRAALLLVSYLPGQERGNVEWVVDIGAEALCAACRAAHRWWPSSRSGSATLAAMREAVRAAARPDATRRRSASSIASMANGALPGVAHPSRCTIATPLHAFRNYAEATIATGPVSTSSTARTRRRRTCSRPSRPSR